MKFKTYSLLVQDILNSVYLKLRYQGKSFLQTSLLDLLKYSKTTSRNFPMSNSECETVLDPPPNVRGMKILDRNAFQKIVSIPYIKVSQEHMSLAMKTLKPYYLKLRSRNVFEDAEEDKIKNIYLDPDKVKSFDCLSENHRKALVDIGVSNSSLQWKNECITYENWNADTILKAVLPTHLPKVSSFSVIGHIVHLNLKPNYTEYKSVIGEVLLDKCANIRTVVNKVNTIDSTYRNFQMELLAGDNDTVVQVKENGLTYKFDFAQVYWNPRLSTEHARISGKVRPSDILYDVFAGVGPFAIPAAKHGCQVLANDLNPACFEWLQTNAKLNKVTSNLTTYNHDGRTFIKEVLKPHLIEQANHDAAGDLGCKQAYVVMNLPASAIQFLDAFCGLFSDVHDEEKQSRILLPLIHVYCFIPKDKEPNYAVKLVEEALNCSLDLSDKDEVILVRDVAPQKVMIRVSFRLPRAVAFAQSSPDFKDPVTKKARLSSNDDDEK